MLNEGDSTDDNEEENVNRIRDNSRPRRKAGKSNIIGFH